jgi:amino acid transporter
MHWVFLLGLLLPIYTITGYDASAHTSEETVEGGASPCRAAWSCRCSGRLLFGYMMLCSFVLMLPNMDDAAKQGWNVFFWAMDTQVNATSRISLYVAILHLAVLCGLATVTSVSRMIFAFSRDGGLPARRRWPRSARPTARRFRRSGRRDPRRSCSSGARR